MRFLTVYLVLFGVGLFGVSLFGVSLFGVSLVPSLRAADNVRTQQREQIERLIQRLGSQQYAERKRAESELRYQGSEAIEQLLEAQYHKTREISLSARQILNSLTINWTRAHEHPVVEQVLRDYDALDSNRRIAKADWLAKLEDGVGFPAVARIVRYEQSDVNAKQAAISLIENFDETQTDHVQSLRKAVQETNGSNRTPMLWLRAFHDEILANQRFDLDEPTSETAKTRLRIWEQFAQNERALDDSPRTNRAIAIAIHRRAAERAITLLKDQSDDAPARQALDSAVNFLVEFDGEAPLQLIALGGWLLDEGQEAVFQKQIWEPAGEKLRKTQPQLVYLAAESYLKTDATKSEQLAEEAFAIHELKAVSDEEDPDDSESDLDTPEEIGLEFRESDPLNLAFLRINTAIALEGRGRTEWAIREYRRLMNIESDHWRISPFKEQAAIIVSELLHDRQRDAEAAEALASLMGKKTIEVFNEDRGKAAGLEARMQYFRSEHYRQEGDREKQIEHLRKAIKADPTDADVLIAMHRLPRADEKWKQNTRKRIRAAVQTFEVKIQQEKAKGEIVNRAEVAKNLNQLAWLVGNTEGDYKRAIEQSRRSLELRPQSPGSLDTLGRTYFALGDLENALKYQRRAVKLEPYSQQIARQLTEFEVAASQGARGNSNTERTELQESTP